MFGDWKSVEPEFVITLLKSVKLLFSTPDTWVDWPIAVDDRGFEVEPSSPKAERWSLIGATEMLAALDHAKPLCDYVAVATREYLNELSDEKLIKGNFSYEDEVAIVELALEELLKC